jgi:glucokinase
MIVIGVDLGGTNVRAGLVRNGKLAKHQSRSIRSSGSADEVFADLCAVIDAVWQRGVRGIGVGVPSLVDRKTGVIFDTTNIPSWTSVPLRRKLERKYGVPVVIDNDANCFALGERYFGAGRRVENFVGLVIGTGLGAGIISRGALHSGAFCGAGEIGLMPYRDGVLENYASGQLFKGDGALVAAAAGRGETAALVAFAELGKHLAFAFKTILYAYAPAMIVLGGSVSQSYIYFESALHEGLGDFAFPAMREQLRVRVSKVRNVAVLGAASLIADAAI